MIHGLREILFLLQSKRAAAIRRVGQKFPDTIFIQIHTNPFSPLIQNLPQLFDVNRPYNSMSRTVLTTPCLGRLA